MLYQLIIGALMVEALLVAAIIKVIPGIHRWAMKTFADWLLVREHFANLAPAQ